MSIHRQLAAALAVLAVMPAFGGASLATLPGCTLAIIHANGATIPFEPRYVMQLHGNMHRYVGVRDAGKWKTLDNTVEQELPDGTKAVRFVPVVALLTPQTVEFWQAGQYRLHDRLRYSRDRGGDGREGSGWVIERLSP